MTAHQLRNFALLAVYILCCLALFVASLRLGQTVHVCIFGGGLAWGLWWLWEDLGEARR